MNHHPLPRTLLLAADWVGRQASPHLIGGTIGRHILIVQSLAPRFLIEIAFDGIWGDDLTVGPSGSDDSLRFSSIPGALAYVYAKTGRRVILSA